MSMPFLEENIEPGTTVVNKYLGQQLDGPPIWQGVVQSIKGTIVTIELSLGQTDSDPKFVERDLSEIEPLSVFKNRREQIRWKLEFIRLDTEVKEAQDKRDRHLIIGAQKGLITPD